MTYVYYFVHSKIFEKVYINTFQYTYILIYTLYMRTRSVSVGPKVTAQEGSLLLKIFHCQIKKTKFHYVNL